MAVVEFQIEIALISILILKAIDSTLESKTFSFQSSLQACKKKLNFKTLWPLFFVDGVQLPQG